MLHPVHLMYYNVALSDFLTDIRSHWVTLHQNHRGRPGAPFPGRNSIRMMAAEKQGAFERMGSSVEERGAGLDFSRGLKSL